MNVTPPSFILAGIPGLEEFHIWISLPWGAIYIITVLGNIAVLTIIKKEVSLHQPMYYFLTMLLLTDLVSSNASVPKMLLLFWFNARQISYDGCLIQMFLVHSFSFMGSAVLLAMAFDRYIAICHPLRYITILTNPLITKIGLIVVLRGVLLVCPYPLLVRRLPFCSSNVIVQTYCEHMAVANLACADVTVNFLYGLCVVLSVIGLDVLFIAISYFRIVQAVLKLQSKEAQSKAFSTCAAHIGAILICYLPALFSIIANRYKTKIAIHVQILLSNMYLILPPMLNPIVYGINTKQIRVKILVLIHPRTLFSKC
ncbi:olfactory receptor 52P1-like [Ambystoma mexicanum]|uniref:olfactory receptor 52P1-like n=1 Tax=Ambystoma mexicanum TaxID=8296 RepID=UPI0037E97D32